MHGSCPQIRALLIGPLAAIECPWLHIVALTAIGTARHPELFSPFMKFSNFTRLATILRKCIWMWMRIWVINAQIFFFRTYDQFDVNVSR